MWRIRLMKGGPKFTWWVMQPARIGLFTVWTTNLVPGTYIYLIRIPTDRHDACSFN